jgi:toxin-antitoxin system PIN domain toxin
MQLLDVNVLVYAFRDELPQHLPALAFLDSLVNGDDPFGVPELSLSALVRIVTQKPWQPPSPAADVLAFCSVLRAAPTCLVVQPTERHWDIFDRICRATGAKGKLVADAYYAAFAIDRDAEWVTTDRDFATFPGLRWRLLLPDNQVFTNPR